ncbi:MAG TPA: GAF domain-containing protein [Kofleriaceae bacterium]|nr:GAF domain-containing protein [Kofleriaceae bacterium]
MDSPDRRQAALLDLLRMNKADLGAVLRRVTEQSAQVLGVQRVSVWLYNDARDNIVCQDLFKLTSWSHERGLKLHAKDFPRYFAAMDESRILAAHDAAHDPRTSEFRDTYLDPFGITSMLDVPVWNRGKVVGVVCHEHTAAKRTWNTEEQEFATHVADLVGVALLENQLAWLKR